SREAITQAIREHDISLDADMLEIVDPELDFLRPDYARQFYELRQRKGISLQDAELRVHDLNHFGMMMVASGRAEGIVSGINFSYPEVIRPALQILGLAPGAHRTAGMYVMLHRPRGLI